jgi:hypothetical protein
MSKINQLIQNWPKGTIKTVSELKESGYSPQVLKIYTTSKWLTLMGRGAYKLFNDDIDWTGGVYCIQRKKESSVHVGGKTALELKGFSHYVSQQKLHVELFGNESDTLPKWFTKQAWMKNLNFYKSALFEYNNSGAFTTADVNNVIINISSPELAILEMLYLVPKVHSFEEASLIMESLTTLRGELVQMLLEKCNSVKVKRIFLYLSEKYNHTWFNDLDKTKTYLGRGKREIVRNGMLDKKYNITVPKNNEE